MNANDVADTEEQPGGVEERQGVSQGGGPHPAEPIKYSHMARKKISYKKLQNNKENTCTLQHLATYVFQLMAWYKNK